MDIHVYSNELYMSIEFKKNYKLSYCVKCTLVFDFIRIILYIHFRTQIGFLFYLLYLRLLILLQTIHSYFLFRNVLFVFYSNEPSILKYNL